MKEVIFTWCTNGNYYRNIDINRKVFENDVFQHSQSVYNINPTENFGECRVFNQDALKFLFEKQL